MISGRIHFAAGFQIFAKDFERLQLKLIYKLVCEMPKFERDN